MNIYAQQGESVLALRPKIFDAAVFGIPDAEMGEYLKAVVKLRCDGVIPPYEVVAEIIGSRMMC